MTVNGGGCANELSSLQAATAATKASSFTYFRMGRLLVARGAQGASARSRVYAQRALVGSAEHTSGVWFAARCASRRHGCLLCSRPASSPSAPRAPARRKSESRGRSPNSSTATHSRSATTAVRLFGVDAPEGRQPCMRDGREWRCGDAAAAELRRLAGSRSVSCVQRDVDNYGRSVAVCRVGTTDLGGALVSAGFAVAYRRYSDDYVDEERAAQAARRGVWAGEFTAPEEYRRDDRQSDAAAPRSEPAPAPRRDGCSIKGNVNSRGDKIYHTPAVAVVRGDGDRREPRRTLVLHRDRSEKRWLARAARLIRSAARTAAHAPRLLSEVALDGRSQRQPSGHTLP